MALRYRLFWWVVAALLSACTAKPLDPKFILQGNPKTLEEWGQVSFSGGKLRLGPGVIAYDLATPLFTDYAHKLRTIWMPNQTAATYQQDDVLDFPVGTVITKTFYYPKSSGTPEAVAKVSDSSADLVNGALDTAKIRLIETRVLVRRLGGWAAIPYRWNKEQTQALLHRTGDIIPLTLEDPWGIQVDFNYVIPNANQCASCHATDSNNRVIEPIGPKVRHLNKPYSYQVGVDNQVDFMIEMGRLFRAPAADNWSKNASDSDTSASLEGRARAYLDINCSHCHSKKGPADTSGLYLESHTRYGPALGICKLAIAAGRGTGNRLHDIVPGKPAQSILIYRMQSTQPDAMMPEIGRSLAHVEGVDLISKWVSAMTGGCDA